MDGQTLRLVAAMRALDKGVAIGALRRTDEQINIQAGEKAAQGIGKIAAFWTGDKARITVTGQLDRPSPTAKDHSPRGQGCLGMKILADLCLQQLRRADINNVQHLHQVLALAQRIERDTGSIFARPFASRLLRSAQGPGFPISVG